MEVDPQPVSINDLPDEILLNLMSNLDDTSLLHMTRTCKRFRAIAKETFGRTYNGEVHNRRYKIKILGENDDNERQRYRPFLQTFGDNIRAIGIIFVDCGVSKKHWIYESLRTYCTSLMDLDILLGFGVDVTRILLQQPRLTRFRLDNSFYLNSDWTKHSFPNLTRLLIEDSDCITFGNTRRHLDVFFHKNRQLTELIIDDDNEKDRVNIIDSLNGKVNLKLLQLYGPANVPHFQSTIVAMDRLETLTLSGTYSSYRVLDAISRGCKNIKKLKMLEYRNEEWNGAVVAIGRLKR